MAADAPKRDVVLFLGAGFSADAGLPTMAQFGAESDRNVLSWAGMDGYQEAAKLVKPAKEAFDGFKGWCLHAKRFCDVDLGNMEDLFCIVEALEEAGDKEIDLRPVTCPQKPSELRRLMTLWLWKIFQQCPAATERGDYLRWPYRRFMKLLKDRKANARVTVLTTNYYLLFEYFAKAGELQFRLPFDAPGDCTLLSSLQGKRSLVRSYLTTKDKAIRLCKLHGSVSFLGKPDELLRVDDRWLSTAGNPPWLPLFSIRQIAELWPDATPALGIVPPTYAKLQPGRWLTKTWDCASGALRDATAIVFIGYSMPPSDGFIPAMIRGAMAGRKCDELRVFVVDPSAGVHGRYQGFFCHLRNGIRSVRLGFREAVLGGKMKELLDEAVAS